MLFGCAEHDQQLEGESPLPNLMEVNGCSRNFEPGALGAILPPKRLPVLTARWRLGKSPALNLALLTSCRIAVYGPVRTVM
jgi:hypothetical protein